MGVPGQAEPKPNMMRYNISFINITYNEEPQLGPTPSQTPDGVQPQRGGAQINHHPRGFQEQGRPEQVAYAGQNPAPAGQEARGQIRCQFELEFG